ncbi:MAG: hypothetical protein ACI4RJ_05350 [Alphaproteobacteria bacterium]
MKKTILAILMAMMMATTAYARLEKCTSGNGGVLFQGENGQSYCISRRQVNWWSAFSWCKSVGGELVNIDDACPDTGFDTCTNIAGKQTKVTGSAWLATPNSSNSAYIVSASTGYINVNYGPRNVTYYALCY